MSQQSVVSAKRAVQQNGPHILEIRSASSSLIPCYPRDEILAIDFAPEGERSRRVVSRSNARPTGKFPSHRMKRMVHWESQHELNAYRLLDAIAGVIAFREQPCVIRYRMAGVEHRHYPDCLVVTRAGKALWEIKTKRDAQKSDIAARSGFLADALPAWGYTYSVILAEDLGRQPRLDNAQTIRRHGRTPLSFEQQEFARRLFSSIDRVRWSDVANGRHAPLTLQQACRLVLDGVLSMNFDLPLNGENEFLRVAGAALLGESNG